MKRFFPRSQISVAMRRRATWIILTIVLAIIVLTAVMLRLRSQPGASGSASHVTNTANTATNTAIKPALTVTAREPQRQIIPLILQANGNIVAWQEAIIGAEVNGLRLSSVLVNVGDKVRKGQTLASFVSDLTRAEFLQAQAQYENATSEAARARAIQDSGSLSQSQLAQFQLQEKVAKAQLEINRIRLTNTEVKAPDDGIISARLATEGSVVGTGQELFRLLRQSRLEWRAEVTATEVAKIKVGQHVQVRTDSGVNLAGVVRSIAPSANAQTRNVLVYVDLPRHKDLKAGTFAQGSFALGQNAALTIPAQSIVMRDGNPYVFVIDASNKANQRKIETGRRVGERVEVLSGIQAKEWVAVQGAGFLNDADTVNLVK